MQEIFKNQADEISSMIRKVAEDIDFSAPENIMIANAAQESLLNALADSLEVRKQELVEEMCRAVVGYSAKIAVTNQMLRTIGREIGRKEAERERIEEGDTA
ncbi:hypothetical protein D3C74_109640 [compost metagenome]